MTNNDILRSVRYALDMSDQKMTGIFEAAGCLVDRPMLTGLLKKEDDAGYLDCSSALLSLFLDGLIAARRGAHEQNAGQPPKTESPLTNNSILKKLRIAFELKEGDMIDIMKLAGIQISKSELSALFRGRENKNYKECGDQFLRNFLKGLAIRSRNLYPANKP